MSGEIWDLTDADGKRVGSTHARGAHLPEGLFHLVVQICVVRDDGRVLVTQRSATKDDPLAWEFPGGAVLAGELGERAARRELYEETGLDIPVGAFTWIGRCAHDRALLELFAVRVAEMAPLDLDPVEVAASDWIALPEIRRRCDAGLMARVSRLDSVWSALEAFHAEVGKIQGETGC